MKKLALALALLFTLVCGAAVGFAQTQPTPLPAEGMADENFVNVLEMTQDMSLAPHAIGSAENIRVRDYIVAKAAQAGLTAEVLPFEMDVAAMVQEAQALYDASSAAFRREIEAYMQTRGVKTIEALVRDGLGAPEADSIRMHNILVKIDNPSTQEAVMLVSHFDTAPTTPGAADDTFAVACMIDTMQRFAKAGGLKNDVYFLFTDGEEQGLYGAANFVQTQLEVQKDVKVLLNFEARGNAGAVLMFETSANNYGLLQHFTKSVPLPITFSMATAIYELMPNGTDFSEFKDAGTTGLNFAIIEGVENYHEPTDTVENLDKNAAWQYYQTVWNCGEYFATTDISGIDHTQDALFFPFFRGNIVLIPGWLGRVLGFLPLLLAVFLVVARMRRKEKNGALRIIGLALLGSIPAVFTVVFFAGSYLFSIPALLFLLVELCMSGFTNLKRVPAIVLLVFAIFASCLLFAPMVFMIQVALQIWYVAVVFGMLPLVPALAYGIRAIRAVGQTAAGALPPKAQEPA